MIDESGIEFALLGRTTGIMNSLRTPAEFCGGQVSSVLYKCFKENSVKGNVKMTLDRFSRIP